MTAQRPGSARRLLIRVSILLIAITLCGASVAVLERVALGQRKTTRRISSGAATKRNVPRRIGKRQDRDVGQDKRITRKTPRQKGETVGVPWTGARGIERSTEDIMLVQSYAPPSRRPAVKPEREGPDREDLPQNPNSPFTASTAGQIGSGAKVRTLDGLASASPLAPQTVGTNFSGATLADTGAFPPDSMGAVGPSQFVVFLNGRIRTFNKTTGVADSVINVDSDVFFASVLTPVSGGTLNINFTSDPMVRYDRLSGRWFLTIIDVPSKNAIGDLPNRYLIAVSDAASAGVISAGTIWTFYFVQQDTVGLGSSNNEFLDYPSLGIDANALYMGGNMFNATSGFFNGCSVFVIRKSSVLSGGPVVTTAFRGLITTDGIFSPRGVDNYDPAATEGYFIGVNIDFFGMLNMRRIGTPGGTPTISADIPITVSATSFPILVDHLGNTNLADTNLDGFADGTLDDLDDRLFSAHIRNGRLWTAHSIAVTSTGVGNDSDAQRRNGVRWYELIVPPTTGTPTVNQSGTIFDSAATRATSRQYWIPTVGISGQGHAALGFSTAGAPFRADAATNGRLRTDTLGTTQAVNIYTASSTAYNPAGDPGGSNGRRWGDYSFVSLDPIDDMTMWTIQEFCNATNSYAVRVAKLQAPPPATPGGVSPSNIPSGVSSTLVTVTGSSISGSEFYDPGPNLAGPALPFNHITASVSGGVTVNSVTYTDPTHITLDLNTTAAPSGLKNLTVTNPDGQSVTANNVIGVDVTPPVTASPILISEFRFRGALGGSDEFFEIYNNTNSAITVADTNGGSGYGLAGTNTSGVNSLRCTIPNGTVIPARGHFLCTNSTASTGYSLAGAATGNGTFTTGIVDGGGLAVFSTTTAASWSVSTRLDAVGFQGITGTTLFTEGTALTPAGGITSNGEYSFVRKMTTASAGLPQDTNDNQSDFAFVSTNGGIFSSLQSTLGAPGPENLASPMVRNTLGFALLDPLSGSSSSPNRVRNLTPHGCNGSVAPSNCTFGTMTVRRSFTNNTAAPVTRLRFRIVDITTFPTPGAGVAELRALDSSSTVVTVNSIPVTVEGTSIETPPPQALGGGLNSSYGRSLVVGTIVNTAIAPGQTVNIQFVLGVQNTGTFRFLINIEALP